RWVAMFGSVLYILGVLLTATATSQLPIVIGAGVLIGVALACTSSGITANIRPRGGAAPPYARLRPGLGRRLDRHHVHRAGRCARPQDRRLAHRPVGA